MVKIKEWREVWGYRRMVIWKNSFNGKLRATELGKEFSMEKEFRGYVVVFSLQACLTGPMSPNEMSRKNSGRRESCRPWKVNLFEFPRKTLVSVKASEFFSFQVQNYKVVFSVANKLDVAPVCG